MLQLLQPRLALALMLTPAATSRDLTLVQPVLRWTGFFFLCLSSTMTWASFQPLSSIRGLLRVFGVLWTLDASFVKFSVFRQSGVVNKQNWALAGLIDLGIGFVCFLLGRPAIRAAAVKQGGDWETWQADNLAAWEERVDGHAQSPSSAYAQEIQALLAGGHRLQSIDVRQFGDAVVGKSMLHLMCHIGCDTLGWRAHGASEVVGVDFSEKALKEARRIAAGQPSGGPATFVCCNIFDTAAALAADGRVPTQYDCVFTGVGAITWIHDIKRWASVVAACLKPGGKFYIRDGHPMLYTLEYEDDEGFEDRPMDALGGRELVLRHPYFELPSPETTECTSSYTGDRQFAPRKNHEWNHGLGEIVTALIEAGLRIDFLREHKELDWQGSDKMKQADGSTGFGGWQLPPHQREVLPLMFSIRATRM